MNRIVKFKVLTCIILTVLSLPSAAGEYRIDSLMVGDPWSRPLPEVSINGAAYLSVHNQGAMDDQLIGAETEIAGRVEIHTHVNEDGLMKMIHLEQGVKLPAGEMVNFQPGGLHVMLLGLTSPLTAGKEYMLTLVFETAGKLEVMVSVEDREAEGMSHSMPMNSSNSETDDHSGHMQQTGSSN
ncbi:MAG: copper chaperone PCu(A)C [bacterium]